MRTRGTCSSPQIADGPESQSRTDSRSGSPDVLATDDKDDLGAIFTPGTERYVRYIRISNDETEFPLEIQSAVVAR